METDNVWASEPSSSNLARSPFSIVPAKREDQLCSDCDEKPVTCYCRGCGQWYCDNCCRVKPKHLRKPLEHQVYLPDGSPANVSSHRARRLQQAIRPVRTREQLNEEHRLDYATLWFAITSPDDAESLGFEKHPRFSELMQEHCRVHNQPPREVYPRLVSFLGDSGAGKSTLIRWLIDGSRDGESSDAPFPVVGDMNTTPTSSDIHLYRDSVTDQDTPLLFVDCEGFGVAVPTSAATVVTEGRKPDEGQQSKEAGAWALSLARGTYRSIKRRLGWFKATESNRQNALEQLLPRFLYTISDVVVYVMTEAEQKKAGKVLDKLVEWSCKSEGNVWSTTELTARLLQENSKLVDANTTISEYKERLKNFWNRDFSLDEMLKGYFTSVKFIAVPRGEDSSRLDEQVDLLREVIDVAASEAHRSKRDSNMLLSAGPQDVFYQLAFEHFCKSKDKAFDFMETFFSIHPLPVSFQNTAFELFRSAQTALANSPESSSEEELAGELVTAVIPFIASIIAISVARPYSQLPCSISQLVRGETSEPSKSRSDFHLRDFSFEKRLALAVDEFVKTSVRCGLVSPTTQQRCVGTERAHMKGQRHVDDQGNVIEYWRDAFECSAYHDAFQVSWMNALNAEMMELDGIVGSGPPLIRQLCTRRQTYIKRMYERIPNMSFPDRSACFWCFQSVPTERFPCGHWICELCLRQTARQSPDDDRLYLIEQCDRHGEITTFSPPFEYLHLPRNAGRRLLCLDEGGVRAIIELVILVALQKRLGDSIPLQDCFDLIGGSGAGGVIGLGLGLGQWRVSEAIEEFKRCVAPVFSERAGSAIFSWILDYPYRSEKLHQGIRKAFGERGKRPMREAASVGGSITGGATRVFVTSSVKGRGGNILLTNYNRPRDVDLADRKTKLDLGTHTFSCDLSIEEAAMATVSRPALFDKPFRAPNGDEFLGANPELHNPAQVTLLEAKYLWSHAMKQHPDVLVSVGAGCSGVSDKNSDSKNCQNAEATWVKAFGEASKENPARYVRLCPRFSDALPAADDVASLVNGSLEDFAFKVLEKNGLPVMIAEGKSVDGIDLIYRRLISTTFYFHHGTTKASAILGQIRCRFKHASDIAKAVGKKMREFKNARFVLESYGNVLWEFHEETLATMESKGELRAPVEFNLPGSSKILDIKLYADQFRAESISGCPLHVDSLLDLEQ
ncbi:hypothetical protein C8A03DRAFT_38972 [Achaetomium macrosporum]|uniref:PNPLA domain-containing protein n=1 Tax=Achaetomium macrosporum TaxID=79813 RepID=A0AAN7C1G4_9PEZI|nr:hypothetical protein C8A03DRAFT_38972 [Achaetomium macrosporum]